MRSPDRRRREPLSTSVVGCLVLLALGSTLAGCREDPWTVQELGSDADFRDVFFLNAEHGWIVGGGHNVNGGILGETRDGGETWQFRSGLVAEPQNRLFHLNGVYFHDLRNALIVADGGRILRSVDGGEHWHSLYRNGRMLSTLFFLDEQLGWAAGDRQVVHTRDGGKSWTRINRHGDGHDDFTARAIHFVDAERGLLVGDHGRIHRSEDGGRTWTRVHDLAMQDAPRLWGLHFAGPDLAWSVGERGLILHSADGGRTWASQASGTTDDLRDVHFVDAGRGWAVGFDVKTGTSSVLHTLDGGATWDEQQRIAGDSLWALFFLDTGQGWALGDRVRHAPQKLLRYAPPAP